MSQFQKLESSHQSLSCLEKRGNTHTHAMNIIFTHCIYGKSSEPSSLNHSFLRNLQQETSDHLICFWSLQRHINLLTRAWMIIAALSFSFCPFLSSLACLALSRNSDLELWGTLNIVHPGKKLFKIAWPLYKNYACAVIDCILAVVPAKTSAL